MKKEETYRRASPSKAEIETFKERLWLLQGCAAYQWQRNFQRVPNTTASQKQPAAEWREACWTVQAKVELWGPLKWMQPDPHTLKQRWPHRKHQGKRRKVPSSWSVLAVSFQQLLLTKPNIEMDSKEEMSYSSITNQGKERWIWSWEAK